VEHNIYEILEKIHALTGEHNGQGPPPQPMDVAEVEILHARLGDAALELVPDLIAHGALAVASTARAVEENEGEDGDDRQELEDLEIGDVVQCEGAATILVDVMPARDEMFDEMEDRVTDALTEEGLMKHPGDVLADLGTLAYLRARLRENNSHHIRLHEQYDAIRPRVTPYLTSFLQRVLAAVPVKIVDEARNMKRIASGELWIDGDDGALTIGCATGKTFP
jgi:hypothetical protein